MTKITFNGHVWAKKERWDREHRFAWYEGDDSSTFLRYERGYLPIGAVSFEFEIPDSFNPVTAEIESLNIQKKAIEIAFHKRVAEINDRICNLQCLEFNPTEKAEPIAYLDDGIPF
jgi:hypothetical protein